MFIDRHASPQNRAVRHSARIAALAVALASLSCSDSSGPGVGTVPARITVVSGVAPTGYAAGTVIVAPIVVLVTDAADLPVPDTRLSFNTTGGGWVSEDPVITDGAGKAEMHWNLGREAGANSLIISLTASSGVPPVEIRTTTIAGAVAFVFMGPPAATMTQGTALQLVATAADANFNAVPGAAISWVSSNATAVSVSSSGLLTAAAPGDATIGATANGATAYSTITVPVPAGPGGPGIPPFTVAITQKNDNAIRIIRSDGTVESTVSCGSQCIFLAGPNWSRDGSKFAATGRRDTESVLFVANRDGTGLHEVASTPRYPLTVGVTTSWYWPEFNEDWSADGRLIYVRQTQTTRSVETVAADGTGRTIVMPPANPGVGNPRWGLGDSMVTAEMGGQIYAMNPDGSGFRQLTSLSSGVFEHRWSPDGKTIAFSNITGITQGTIFILDPVSGALRQIPVSRLRAFCWSPNSSQLSLVSLENELQGWLSIYTVNADGTGLRRAVIAILDIFNPVIGAWSPDGKFLVYLDDRVVTGVPGAGQLYAQSIAEGTNTKLSDVANVVFFSIAEARGCGRSFQYP
jgi:WD40 repeat protein